MLVRILLHLLDKCQLLLSTGHKVRGDVSRFADATHQHATTWQNTDPGDGGMVQAETQPPLGRELKGPAHKIPDHVGMTDHQLVAVLVLGRLCAMEELAKGRLDTGPVLEELLKEMERRGREKGVLLRGFN